MYRVGHRAKTDLAAFWSRVGRFGPNDCWPYNGHRNKDGYGAIRFKGVYLAHRLTWTLANGPIPKGQHVLHRCDNPPCVNPAHLFLGRDRENAKDRVSKGRHNAPKLTVSQVREIKRLLPKMKAADIAARFNVSKNMIGHIKAGRQWAWVA